MQILNMQIFCISLRVYDFLTEIFFQAETCRHFYFGKYIKGCFQFGVFLLLILKPWEVTCYICKPLTFFSRFVIVVVYCQNRIKSVSNLLLSAGK